MTRSFWLLGVVLSAAVLALTGWPASAQQDYPTKEIRMVLPSPAGPDTTERYFALKLAEKAKVPVIVENKPGAIGNIASEYVVRSRPDGYTFMISGASGTHASAKYNFKNLSFDPQKDFTPITTISKLALVLVVNPNTPAKTLKELTAYLKKKDKVTYGTFGSTSVLAGEIYNQEAGLKAVAANYRSPSEVMNELINNQLDYAFLDSGTGLTTSRDGRLRAIATSSGERLSVMAEIPSLKDAGIDGYDMTPWFAAFGPAGMPQPIVNKLAGWINEIVATPETREFIGKQGMEPFPGNPKMTADFLAKEIPKWESMLTKANIPRQ